ncbi:hypothetical protein K2P56_02100 [Patescibacteria group bacterium]|nr:hypothetical protein [Patescibacteria group bacterium]
MQSYLQILEAFGLDTLPTLDVCVLATLERFERDGIPKLPQLSSGKILIVGSVNAAATGRILATYLKNAVCADESDYEKVVSENPDIILALLISASGGKHAVRIAQDFQKLKLRTILVTHNPAPLAGEYVEKKDIFLLPKNREPYTYNTSTYLGIILSVTQESPLQIRTFIENAVIPKVRKDFEKFDAFFITIPTSLRLIAPMLLTKFDELFGSRVSGRTYTHEQAKHATTVVPSPTEFFISFGKPTPVAPLDRNLTIPLPDDAGYGLLVAISYFLIGEIQKQHPPYFKEHIAEYCARASKLFDQNIEPIVS